MKAAVVHDFSRPPRYQDCHEPVATGTNEVVVEVLAAGLHPRVRSQAGGSHYTSTGELPLIPGIDAVVRDPDGNIRYAILDDTTLGTMAERTVIDLDRSVVLPDTIDPVVAGRGDEPRHVLVGGVAAANRLWARQRVAILGATGNAGRMAIQVAKRFGASRVIAVGRDTPSGRADVARRRRDLHLRPARSGRRCRRGDRLRLGRAHRRSHGGDHHNRADRGRAVDMARDRRDRRTGGGDPGGGTARRPACRSSAAASGR